MAKGIVRKPLRASVAIKGKKIDPQAKERSAAKTKGVDGAKVAKKGGVSKTRKRQEEDDLASESDEETMQKTNDGSLAIRFLHESSDEDETQQDIEQKESAQDRRVRLAKDYLQKIEELYANEGTNDEEQRGVYDMVTDKLTQDLKESTGRIQRKIAHQLTEKDISIKPKMLKLHSLPITAVVASEDGQFIYSASKDCTIAKYNLATGKKTFYHQKKKTGKGHVGHILALALSSNGKYLVSGGKDKNIYVWNTQTDELMRTFSSHRGTVTCLAFRRDSNELYSGSMDRTIKIWDMESMSLVDTLFGHQAEVIAMDCLSKDRPVSVGYDRSCRVWKIQEETQLVFHGHEASIDCVTFVNEENYVTGSQDGSLSFWSLSKKKPVNTYTDVHHGYPIAGPFKAEGGDKSSAPDSKKWITSVASCRNSDLLASGSCDGYIRLWQSDARTKTLTPVSLVRAGGVVNGLAFAKGGSILVAAASQEPRLGRWFVQKGHKNALMVFDLGIQAEKS